jgi:hypothetical protein
MINKPPIGGFCKIYVYFMKNPCIMGLQCDII